MLYSLVLVRQGNVRTLVVITQGKEEVWSQFRREVEEIYSFLPRSTITFLFCCLRIHRFLKYLFYVRKKYLNKIFQKSMNPLTAKQQSDCITTNKSLPLPLPCENMSKSLLPFPHLITTKMYNIFNLRAFFFKLGGNLRNWAGGKVCFSLSPCNYGVMHKMTNYVFETCLLFQKRTMFERPG